MKRFRLPDGVKAFIGRPSRGPHFVGVRWVFALLVLSLILAFATFLGLAGGVAFGPHPALRLLLLAANLLTAAALVAVTGLQLHRLWTERRMGVVGSRLHTKIVTLFAVIAVTPTVILGVLAALFFHYGVEIWFSARVDRALTEARSVAVGYLREHNENARTEAFGLANSLLSAQTDEFFAYGRDFFADPQRLGPFLEEEVIERGLSAAVVFDPLTNAVLGTGGIFLGKGEDSGAKYAQVLPPKSMIAMAGSGGVAVMDQPKQRQVRAVISLGGNTGLMLAITRPVNADILHHMERTASLVRDYKRLLDNRGKTQFVLVGIFALMGLIVLIAGVLSGLFLAKRIATPLGLLILASRRVSEGDLEVRVPVQTGRSAVALEEKGGKSRDEVTALSIAFNRMTDQLQAQRGKLVAAYNALRESKRFTETVLSGVSAGVIGLDAQEIIQLPNRAASRILGRNLEEAIGSALADSVPEFQELLAEARSAPQKAHLAEIQIDFEGASRPGGPGPGGGAGAGHTLQVRIMGEEKDGRIQGYVVTFDDITPLQIAQRKGAWADVARRVAHEIKNPLTPIQLAAERLKKRFGPQIETNAETYNQLADMIIRQVGDIGKMVDEFSAFAHMPQPELGAHDIIRLCREAVIMQQTAHPGIVYRMESQGYNRLPVICDRRLIAQALTNLLQNAADAVEMQTPVSGENGRILLEVGIIPGEAKVRVAVQDSGIGLPDRERHRLTEPYVTHKAKGTGLGLAIVRRIMDAHQGDLMLMNVRELPQRIHGGGDGGEDRRGAVVTLVLPLAVGENGAETLGELGKSNET